MVENIIDRICANLASLPFFAEVYGVAELVKDKYAVIKSGEGKPVFYQDARNGLVYLRKNGRVQIETSEEKSDLACDDYQTRRHPYRVVAVAKRGSLNNAALSSLAANVSAALDIELKKSERAPLGLSEAYVEITGYLEDREDLISSEKLPEKLSLDLAVVAVDIEIVLGGQQACFDATTCFVPPAPPVIINRVPAVTFSPASGTYAGFLPVVMENELEGVSIYYTTNGSFPTPQSGILYTEPVVITANESFNAVGYLDGYLPSFVAQISYQITPLVVFAVPQGGEYLRGTLPAVSLGANRLGALIYYTTDGSEPTESSTLFNAALPISVITELKFRGFDAPAAPSEIVTEVYNIKATAPTLDTQSGVFISSKLVTATNTNPLGQNEYSIDGGSYVTGDSVLVEETASVAFRTAFEGYVTSDEVTINVEIQCAAPTISPDGGVFEDSQEVTITTNEPDGVTYYTTDGSEPTESSTLYSVPFTITATTDVKAKTFRSGTTPSVVESVVFTLAIRAFVAANFNGQVYLSMNKGASWSDIAPAALSYLGVTSQEGASPIVAFSTTGIRRTIDLGLNWTSPTAPTGHQSFEQGDVNNNNGLCFASRTEIPASRNIFITTDGFATLAPITIGGKTASDNWTAVAIKGNTMVAVRSSITTGDNLEVYVSRDLGANWVLEYTEANRVCRSLYISDDEQTIALGKINIAGSAGTASILISNDNGNMFTEIEAGYNFVTGNGEDVVYLISLTDTIRRSTNRGVSFVTASTSSLSGTISSINCNSIDDRLLVTTSLRIYMSSNQGSTIPEIQPAGNVSRNWRQTSMV